jgi:hypothetical protein
VIQWKGLEFVVQWASLTRETREINLFAFSLFTNMTRDDEFTDSSVREMSSPIVRERFQWWDLGFATDIQENEFSDREREYHEWVREKSSEYLQWRAIDESEEQAAIQRLRVKSDSEIAIAIEEELLRELGSIVRVRVSIWDFNIIFLFKNKK